MSDVGPRGAAGIPSDTSPQGMLKYLSDYLDFEFGEGMPPERHPVMRAIRVIEASLDLIEGRNERNSGESWIADTLSTRRQR